MKNWFSNCYIRFLYLLHRLKINYSKKPKDKEYEHQKLVDDVYKTWQPNWKTYGQ